MSNSTRNTSLLAGDITDAILGAFFRVYDYFGFGFLESVYCEGLMDELDAAGLRFVREAPVAVFYKGRRVGHYRADFVVENRVVVEVKASEALAYAHKKQLLNCLRCSRLEVGLLLHFGPKPRFERVIHTKRNAMGGSNGPR